MRRMVLAVLVLAGCSEEISPEERAAQAERDIAMVEEANKMGAPLREITPEPILYPDIERYDLLGKACNFAPGTSLGTRVIARPVDAFVKVEGEMMRFAADPGARELLNGTRSVYNGREYSLQLRLDGEGEPSEGESVDYEGTVTLRDPQGRVVYEGTGLAQCRT
ncbi:hypothetical protein FHS61_002112 [Altererythrobacter atlanticus]|uniref:Uncharacterized protein n=1 Tax=Croceibacterium atlanticum TaxID=1267766 RepID=A0A0F7KPZ3_9SPHN|nr:hypothetical protein [Croceibacterium atlanticum]AKH41624.1 hypothetical protein WYH_00566 [Croceibacterium atlanticum]MBB5733086.1 hypothetical protein [Croceibacterium atlanticum]